MDKPQIIKTIERIDKAEKLREKVDTAQRVVSDVDAITKIISNTLYIGDNIAVDLQNYSLISVSDQKTFI